MLEQSVPGNEVLVAKAKARVNSIGGQHQHLHIHK